MPRGKRQRANPLIEHEFDLALLLFAFGPRTIRLVTHLDVSRAQCERAADVLLEVVGS